MFIWLKTDQFNRRVTRPRLRIIVKETRGYPTDYLQAPSDTIKYDPESREVGCETSFFLSRLWINRIIRVSDLRGRLRLITSDDPAILIDDAKERAKLLV